MAHDLKIQLEVNNLEVVGELLDKNWKIKCQMARGITDSIDEWYKQGIKAGAKGKLLGAGNRGFLMFFAPVEKHRDIANAMGMLKEMPLF